MGIDTGGNQPHPRSQFPQRRKVSSPYKHFPAAAPFDAASGKHVPLDPKPEQDRTPLFIIVEEFDDYLECTGYDPWAKIIYSEEPGGALAKVAKPFSLQKTPWDGQVVEYKDVTVGYTYDAQVKGKRLATDQGGGGNLAEIQYITPDYIVGEVLMIARARIQALDHTGVFDLDENAILYVDITPGRQWAMHPAESDAYNGEES
tara:strand:+ start:295 stop:903 length:609 start_codon:yes stop_codon:yes gene_type:complete